MIRSTSKSRIWWGYTKQKKRKKIFYDCQQTQKKSFLINVNRRKWQSGLSFAGLVSEQTIRGVIRRLGRLRMKENLVNLRQWLSFC